MKSETRLDLVVFQLTPTRTRCDLVIIANGKKEKIASGLLNPFLAHLKTAQDQIEKGGYSITLELDTEADAAWFTKETVERFVRFVSTPEILERVSTIESEILQIENAIAIQSNDNLVLSTVEVRHSKTVEFTAGSKATGDTGAEKAMILYTPGSQTHASDSNGSAKKDENSKAQLLRVLETRKSVLQKEQGMAFARAVAAGFAIDNMSPLISFAESFGALRLLQACTGLIDLWKKKHETGQWIDVEAIEERSEFLYTNQSGIMLTADSLNKKESGETWPVPGGDATADGHREVDEKVPLGLQEHFPGQFQHPTYAQWALHSSPGAPVFQPFPVPGMPYYPNYPGPVPYYHHPYPPTDDSRFSTPVKMGSQRHSMENKESNNGSDTWERSTKSHEGTDENLSDTEKERSQSHNKVGRSGKKKSGVVVIQNLNYIASKKHGAAGSESQSASDAETEEDSNTLNPNSQERRQKRSHRSSVKDEDGSRSFRNSCNKEDAYEPETDAGNWQVFQNFLLRAEEKNRAADGALFSGEKAAGSKRKQSKNDVDPLDQHGRDDLHEQQITGLDRFSGEASKMKKAVSGDEIIALSKGRRSEDDQFKEIEGGRGGYRKMSSDEITIYGREKRLSNRRSSDPIADGLLEPVGNHRNKSLLNPRDESFLLPHRSAPQGHVPERRTAIDMGSEIPTSRAKTQNSRNKGDAHIKYEPDAYLMLPRRGTDNVSTSYDPALDNGLHIPVRNALKLETRNEISSKNAKNELKKLDKDKKSKLPQDSLEKKRKEALTKKETSSRLNPSVEAQLRAQKLRSYKADMQKLKKEKEEEALKRLEALKVERQKRIAAKSHSAASKVPQIAQQTKARVATKISPSVTRGSKFSDAEPRRSPLTRLPVRTASMGSNDFKAKSNKSTGPTRSMSSLPMVKERNGLLSEAKVASLRTKRLSDPQGSLSQRVSSLKSVVRDQAPKKLPYESERRKMTAIMQSDQRKSATLPELKIRTQKPLSDAVMKKPSVKEAMQKVGTRSSQASINGQANNNEKSRRFTNNEDNNLVIEKSLVTLEDNQISAIIVQKDGKERLNRERLGLEQAGNRASPSPVSQVNSGVGKLDNHPNSYEDVVAYSKPEPQKFSNLTVMEKPYQAPYARVSSFEEQLVTNTESYRAPYARVTSLEERTGSSAEHSSLKTVDETDISTICSEIGKPQSKEPKGFRKLLTLGRKSNSLTSGDGNLGSDSSADDHLVASSSNDAPMLKNLISQDGAPAGGTPPKVNRPFSLLSPFRSKTTEKKTAG